MTPSGSSRLTHCLPSLGAADAIDHHGDWVAAARTIAPGGVDAAHWLRENAPDLKVRVVNVVDLMTLFPREFYPHGMDETRFVELFTADKPVVFAFHGYQRAIHEIVHGHVDVDRFHVRGFSEQGTTTTPFDMVVLNGMSRYHLAAEALRRAGDAGTPLARDWGIVPRPDLRV